MNLFYFPDINTEVIVLDKENSIHCCSVLRKQSGDCIDLTDGKGFFYKGTILEANPKRTIIQIVEKKATKRNWNNNIHMCMAPTKNISRTEWALEKCTEIGVNEITPFVSFHSERKVIKPQRLEKILIAALKQSLKAWLPQLNPIIQFKELVNMEFPGQKFIAYIDDDYQELLSQKIDPDHDIMVLIGPEGDFSKEEVDLAIDLGFKPISLGKERLRTETAAILACQTIHVIQQIRQ